MKVDSRMPFERAIPFDALEPRVTDRLFQLLRPGDTFVDVGAWIGYFTLIASRLVGEQGNVIAVEPSEENLKRIAENTTLNGFRNVRVVAAAVGPAEGSALLEEGASSSTSRLSSEGYQVRTVTLDSVVGPSNVRLACIDVEGYELEVLKGADLCLSSGALQNLIVEVHPRRLPLYGATASDVMDLLKLKGYHIELIDSPTGTRAFHVLANLAGGVD